MKLMDEKYFKKKAVELLPALSNWYMNPGAPESEECVIAILERIARDAREEQAGGLKTALRSCSRCEYEKYVICRDKLAAALDAAKGE